MRTYNNQSTGVLISQPLVITATEIRLDSLLIFFLSLSLSLWIGLQKLEQRA